MTDLTIRVVALVVSPDILTFYKVDGSVFTVTQGDPRGPALSDEFLAQRKLGVEIVPLVIGEDTKQSISHLNSPKRNPLIRFFRAPLDAVKKLFTSEVLPSDLTDEHEAAAAKVKALAQKLMATKDGEIVQSDDLPIRMVNSEEPMGKDETIIGVTEDGIIPHVESLNDQFEAGDEGKGSAVGPEQLILRLTKMSQKRGHTASELLKFIEKIDLPILPDGSFLAYKRLLHRGDGVYVDPHTKSVHQRIGDIVEMDEKLVDPSRRVECSQGLHVGTRHYMGGFHGSAEGSGTMLVIIQPEDAIAVPLNETSKMRACRYQIVADLSNKAHNLVNQNKRMDDCKDTMAMIAQIVAGARPPALGRVIIGGAGGSNLRYDINGKQQSKTNLTYQEALAISEGKATAPTQAIAPVRTIDETKNGTEKAVPKPEVVRDKANAVKPTDFKAKASEPAAPVRVQVAAQLYGRMSDKKNTDADRLAAATELKAHKQRCKVSYEALKLPKGTANEIEEIITVATPSPAKGPAGKQGGKEQLGVQGNKGIVGPAGVKTPVKAPEPKKAEPVKAAQPTGTRQERARTFWDTLTNTANNPPTRKKAAEDLRGLKKAAKVSWENLGLYTHKVEPELKKLLD